MNDDIEELTLLDEVVLFTLAFFGGIGIWTVFGKMFIWIGG